MVHRTDIAGRRMRRASPRHDRMCRAALNGALLENNFPSGDTKRCLLLMTALPPLHPIDPELPTL
jgi:hypothetical protein